MKFYLFKLNSDCTLLFEEYKFINCIFRLAKKLYFNIILTQIREIKLPLVSNTDRNFNCKVILKGWPPCVQGYFIFISLAEYFFRKCSPWLTALRRILLTLWYQPFSTTSGWSPGLDLAPCWCRVVRPL